MLVTIFQVAFGAIHISGSIGGKTLRAEDGPFIVEADISIPKGQKTTILPGCVILFKPFTGLNIHGYLEALGAVDRRIIFTSENDENFFPTSTQPAAAFDWNGITIHPGTERAVFRNANISFTVFGIKSQIENVVIDNCIFSQNGQYHFTVNERVIGVHENIPVYYYVKEDEAARKREREREEMERKAARRERNLGIVRKTGAGILLVGGAALGAWGGMSIAEIGRIDQELQRLNASIEDFDFSKDEELKSKRGVEQLKSLVGLGGAGLCIPSGIVLFATKSRRKPGTVPKIKVGVNFLASECSALLSWNW